MVGYWLISHFGWIEQKEEVYPLTGSQFTRAVRLVEENDLDGVVVFVWSDLLEEMMVRKNAAHIKALLETKSTREDKLG